jgi:hypothetical protein
MVTATKRRAKPKLSSLVSAAAVRGATSSGGLASATMSGYASDGKKHVVGIRAAHEEHQQAYLRPRCLYASRYFQHVEQKAVTQHLVRQRATKLRIVCVLSGSRSQLRRRMRASRHCAVNAQAMYAHRPRRFDADSQCGPV